jgi:hypothetical protein
MPLLAAPLNRLIWRMTKQETAAYPKTCLRASDGS